MDGADAVTVEYNWDDEFIDVVLATLADVLAAESDCTNTTPV